jgi:hypothetical protein
MSSLLSKLTPGPASLLDRAADLVEQAITALDTAAAVPCATCGLKHFNNLTHHRVHDALADTPRKLRTAASKLKGESS